MDNSLEFCVECGAPRPPRPEQKSRQWWEEETWYCRSSAHPEWADGGIISFSEGTPRCGYCDSARPDRPSEEPMDEFEAADVILDALPQDEGEWVDWDRSSDWSDAGLRRDVLGQGVTRSGARHEWFFGLNGKGTHTVTDCRRNGDRIEIRVKPL